MAHTADSVIQGANIPHIVANILSARGMTAAEMAVFVYPDYLRDLHNPMLLTDMELAVVRIERAARLNEQVVIYGDYDIDGITASAVMIEGLAPLGITAISYIPDRFEEGYGINRGALELLQSRGAQLVISVDCGITSIDEARWAKAHGLDLIITDHHAVPAVLPEAIAVINPHRAGERYPFKDLAGVGVAFKVVQALQQRLGIPSEGQEKWLLDLVAMGTICDVVPLVGENRVLATYGLKVLRQTRRIGMRALCEVGQVDISKLSAYDVGFVLGPRMNAAGRLEHAARSVELVLTHSTDTAQAIAGELEELNRQRRADQATILAEADEMASSYADDSVLLLAHSDWSHGVVGIVASKLAEKWQKPVLLAQVLGDRVKGSARSVPGFNMVEALRSQAHLLEKFGGHFFAAGYTLPVSRMGELRLGLNDYYRATMLAQSATAASKPDISLADMEQVDAALMDSLVLLEPHGNANPRPLVLLSDLRVLNVRRVGADKKHLSLKLIDAMRRPLSAIGFNLAERYAGLAEGAIIRVAGTLSNNEYQGKTSIQMILSDISYE